MLIKIRVNKELKPVFKILKGVILSILLGALVGSIILAMYILAPNVI